MPWQDCSAHCVPESFLPEKGVTWEYLDCEPFLHTSLNPVQALTESLPKLVKYFFVYNGPLASSVTLY